MSFVEPRTDALTVVGVQSFAVGAASAQSAPFGSTGRIVRICPSTTCHIAFGVNPVATTNDMLVPANTVLTITVKPGWRIAAIQSAAPGTCSVAECL